MKKVALLVALLLGSITQSQEQINVPVIVVFVQPGNERFTNEEQTQSLEAIHQAIDYWQTLAPITNTLVISTTWFIATDPNVYQSLAWSAPYLALDSNALTIFVIDNSDTRYTFFGSTVGQAQMPLQAAWVVLYGYPGEQGLQAAIAHELGHVVYHLPDVYQHGLWLSGVIDIMNNPSEAYQLHTIGCQSLARLGRQCSTMYLPIVNGVN